MRFAPTPPRVASADSRRSPRPRRVFVRVASLARFAGELAEGCLVRTRLSAACGEALLIAVLTERAARPVDVPARVIGRRALGPVGLRVQARPEARPALELLRALEGDPESALVRRVQEHSRVRATASFPSLSALCGELLRLLAGQVAILPLPAGRHGGGARGPAPGDRLDVVARASGQPSLLSFDAVCRGVARLDDGVRCLVSLLDDEAREALCSGLRRLDPSAVRGYLEDKRAFTAP